MVHVGIMSGVDSVNFMLHGVFYCDGMPRTGSMTYHSEDLCEGERITFRPASDQSVFELRDVVIGINFHWERKENQRFQGELELLRRNGKLIVINNISVESYLKSVISSEMSATASIELLKAHAVISRSWLLAQIQKNGTAATPQQSSNFESDDIIMRWYDREDHTDFHVCADDHCQRYQGITRQTTRNAALAVDATEGLVLVDPTDGRLCDARFSKCCGGVFEEFESCWEPVHYNYLIGRRDYTNPENFPDLRQEEEAVWWIKNQPDAFCNTADKEILGQVLNNYDQETTDFYRWEVVYTPAELSAIIKEKSGIDFGEVQALIPEQRGVSGRLIRLKIVGSKRTMSVGKELEIRRWLSKSHLYSSAFIVNRDAEGNFHLRGAGWGHGVGLCQIGAAVMATKGYNYQQILSHYYPGAELKPNYNEYR